MNVLTTADYGDKRKTQNIHVRKNYIEEQLTSATPWRGQEVAISQSQQLQISDSKILKSTNDFQFEFWYCTWKK